MIPYEILIRGNSGKLSGVHAIDTPTSEARPLSAKDLAIIAPEINAEAIAQRDAITAEFFAYKNAANSAATAIKSVIADSSIDDASTISAIVQIVAIGEVIANGTQRERDLLEAQSALASAQAKVTSLLAETP